MGVDRLAGPVPSRARGLRARVADVARESRHGRGAPGNRATRLARPVHGDRRRPGVKLIPTTRGGSLWRFALASLLVIGFAAATTAVAGLLQVKNIVDALNLSPSLKDTGVQLPAPGEPQ